MTGVDQLLLGYVDGHGLVASSRPLSAAQLRDVLPHTDASFERPDERELVGIWIPSLDSYLLARIWSAPERPRPGAVWAHVLLLSFEQLCGGDLSGLLGLLCRPAAERYEGYREPLAWPAPAPVSIPAEPLSRALVWAALDARGRAGVVLWDTPGEAEDTLLALLEALPAAARAQFSFRTRERARLGGGPYRVQVASGLGGAIAHAADHVIDARQPPPGPPPLWVNLLEDDPTAARHRDFIRRYGAEDARTPAQASALATIAALLATDAAPVLVVRHLVRNFPQADQVPELRQALLGPAASDGGLWSPGEAQRLGMLWDYADHFDVVGLDLDRRIAALAASHPDVALRLVERPRRVGRSAAA